MKTSYSGATVPRIYGAKIEILQSKWHSAITDKMVSACSELLLKAEATYVKKHILPGCLELPLAAADLATLKPDCIIVFGIIVKGDTYHFDLVLEQCILGFSKVSLDTGVPIIQEILPVTKIEQAIERSSDDENNKGIEAAIAAAEFINWRRELQRA